MSTSAGLIRAFIAIDIPQGARQTLAETVRELADQVPGNVGWVAAQGIHLTLKFLGDIPSQDVGTIIAALRSPVHQISTFPLQLSGLGMFPNERRPRVLWAGVEGQQDSLVSLQQCVEDVLVQMDYATERQTFSPHLTLGRVRDRISPGARRRIIQAMLSASPASKVVSEPWMVEQVHLFRTTFTPKGSVHTSMGSVPLATDGPRPEGK